MGQFTRCPSGESLALQEYSQYNRDDVARQLGIPFVPSVWNQGVVRLPDCLILFVTISKKDLAPEHRYADSLLSDSLLRWQSQNRELQTSGTGRRYRESSRLDAAVLLFVRPTKMAGASRREFTYLGHVKFVDQRGDRPITVVWRLEHPLPAQLLNTFGLGERSFENVAQEADTEEDLAEYSELERALKEGSHQVDDVWRRMRARPKQSRFRRLVLLNFGNRCAVCGIDEPLLVEAAHLKGYSPVPAARADPANGIALCALHHKALDRGLMRLTPDGHVAVAVWLLDGSHPSLQTAIVSFHGRSLLTPHFPVDYSWLPSHAPIPER